MKFGEILSCRERPTTLADVMGSWTSYVLQMAADMRKSPARGALGYEIARVARARAGLAY